MSVGTLNGLAVPDHTQGQHKLRGPRPHTDLDIRLKPVDFRGVVHVAEPSLLVDEALGYGRS